MSIKQANGNTYSSPDLSVNVGNEHPHYRPTIRKNENYVTDISHQNRLFKFASYNSLFTLSALSQAELENTKGLLTRPPHDVIIQSSGMGGDETARTYNQFTEPLDLENQKTVSQNERLSKTLDKAKSEFTRNRDMYFRSVTMNSVPGLNEKRRATSVTQIQMEIIEPFGITLLSRIQAAAANNNYLDHLDAPYLLTIDFQGFDEHGKLMREEAKNLKRVIPINLTNMTMNVTQAGTVYSVTAIPVNETAYLNHYAYPRTSGSIGSLLDGKKFTFAKVVNELQELLNKQNKDEQDRGFNGIPDRYEISIDKKFKPDTTEIPIENINQVAMSVVDPGPDQEPVAVNFMQVKSSDNIIKILEEIIKSHPNLTDDKFKSWKAKAGSILRRVQEKGGAEAVFDRAVQSASNDMYFDYFRIRSTVIPTEVYDPVRKTNVKKIKYVVEPYKVHAYSLAIPGVSTGQNFKDFVFKTYNYIFTGENTDVLDLDINYKVAYFQSRLKDVEPDDTRKNKTSVGQVEREDGSIEGGGDSYVVDGSLNLKTQAGQAKSAGTGKTGTSYYYIDQFVDYLTHPLADMVNVRMEILGDPAWISQSQFIPANPDVNFGVSTDKDIDYWRGNLENIWNTKYECYNTDLAEPIIFLKFRMPTDINDRKGTYEMQKDDQAEFSGLYRVITVEHNFVDGKYTCVLNLTRFNNQGVYISSPVTSYVATGVNGIIQKVSQEQLKKLLSGTSNYQDRIIDIGRKINQLKEKAKSLVAGLFKG